MIRVGIIHIGSSKIRLMLAEVEDIGYFKIIDELKTPFKVCYELSKECVLCSEKLIYILSTLRTYKSLCEASGTKEIFTITTSFFNDIKDSESIISMIKLNLNLDLKILSPEEEIKFTALSVNRSLNTTNSLIVEITGTSTNLISMKNREIANWVSLPFGGINLAYTFNIADRILNSNLDESISFLKDKLNDISRDFVQNTEIDPLEAIGRLREVDAVKDYNQFVYFLGTAMASASFAYLIGGTGILDFCLTLIIASIGVIIYNKTLKLNQIPFFATLISSFFIAVFGILLVKYDILSSSTSLIVGSIMPLLPGVSFIKGLRDLISGNLIAGISRIVDACLTAAAIAVGVGVVLDLAVRFGG